MDKMSINDTGWCDYETGARILSTNDRVLFTTGNSKDEIVLKLKFGDRLKGISPIGEAIEIFG